MMTLEYLERNVSNHYEEGDVPVGFLSTVEEHYRQILYQAIWYGCQLYSW